MLLEGTCTRYQRPFIEQLLKKQQQECKPLPEREVWKLTYQIVLGLEYLHSHNIIHRDIKCLNIFLTNDRNIKVQLRLST